jgi:dihydrodipicolinate reductase
MRDGKMHILVIDGQGGRMGAQMVEMAKRTAPAALVTAVGTNSIATAAMLRAGADAAATGENAVIVTCRTADVIVGPIGIVIADAMLGEVTPAMAVAVGQSTAEKLLLPVNHCNNLVVGAAGMTFAELISQAATLLRAQVDRLDSIRKM